MSGTESVAATAAVEPAALAPEAARVQPGRIWNRDFVLLWQGQLVSVLGDVVYSIALGFWILGRTGSTALMGALMAAGTLPRVLAAPFAGVVVDRVNRKWLMAAMDAARGLAVVALAVALLVGAGEVWMVFAAAVLLSVCGAFFFPAVGSALPDIVPKDGLVKANSAMAAVQTGAGLVGNPVGGFLYAALGAPVMFLLNGISYIVSAGAIVLMRIPHAARASADSRFFAELREGLWFVWQYRGVRHLLTLAIASNFFASMGIVLILPLFERTAGLGPGPYGILMASFAAGLALGFLAMSVVNIPYRHRFAVFFIGAPLTSVCAAVMPWAGWLPAMCGLMLAGGAANSLVNSFISASLQAAIPPEVRGRVFSLMAFSAGLMPIAMALGGVLAEFIPLKPLISAAFALTVPVFLFAAFSSSVRRLIGFDPAIDGLEVIK
jgi:MFS family permease